MISKRKYEGKVKVVKAKDGKEYDILLFSSPNGMTTEVAYPVGEFYGMKGDEFYINSYKTKDGYYKSYLVDLK